MGLAAPGGPQRAREEEEEEEEAGDKDVTVLLSSYHRTLLLEATFTRRNPCLQWTEKKKRQSHGAEVLSLWQMPPGDSHGGGRRPPPAALPLNPAAMGQREEAAPLGWRTARARPQQGDGPQPGHPLLPEWGRDGKPSHEVGGRAVTPLHDSWLFGQLIWAGGWGQGGTVAEDLYKNKGGGRGEK